MIGYNGFCIKTFFDFNHVKEYLIIIIFHYFIIDWITTYLNISDIIKKYVCGAQTKITGDLKIKSNRKCCTLYVANTTYINKNNGVIQARERILNQQRSAQH